MNWLYTPAGHLLIDAALVALVTVRVAIWFTHRSHRRLTGGDTYTEAIVIEFRRQLRIELGLEEETTEIRRFVRK